MSVSISRLSNGLLFVSKAWPGSLILLSCSLSHSWKTCSLALWASSCHLKTSKELFSIPALFLLLQHYHLSSWSTLDPSNLFLARGLHRQFHFICLSYALLMSWLSRKACCYFPLRLLQVSQPLQFQPNLALSLNVIIDGRFLDDPHRNQKSLRNGSPMWRNNYELLCIHCLSASTSNEASSSHEALFFEIDVV